MKKLITVAGLAGTLGVAAPAFADWYRPTPVEVPAPAYGMPIARGEYRYDRDDWRRREEWRRHEAWRRHHRWEWERHHRYGW